MPLATLDDVRAVARALSRMAAEHGVPNTFSLQELAAFHGAPAPLVASCVVREFRAELSDALASAGLVLGEYVPGARDRGIYWPARVHVSPAPAGALEG